MHSRTPYRIPGLVLALTALLVAVAACNRQADEDVDLPEPVARESELMSNPLLSDYLTPLRAPPFHELRPEHFRPALDEVLADVRNDIATIAESGQPATFDNTIAAMEAAGRPASQVAATYFGLNAALGGPDLAELAPAVAADLETHRQRILQDPALHERVQAVDRQSIDDREAARLAELTRRAFRRAGADRDAEVRERLAEIAAELARLTETFESNLRTATSEFVHYIDDSQALEGLPENQKAAAARNASLRGREESWAFTLHGPALRPVLRHSPNRRLRQTLFEAAQERAGAEPADNGPVVRRIAALRHERARLLDYDHHADWALETAAADDLESVEALFDRIWEPALARAREELDVLAEAMSDDDVSGTLAPWDVPYYIEQVRSREFDLAEGELRQYFPVDQVREGAFTMANRLWRLTFHERTDMPQYHRNLRVFEVRDADGTDLGAIYMDYFQRDGKRPGAWMSTYRPQHRNDDGERVTAVVSNVANFVPTVAGEPALLGIDEVRTVFHEFGHALQGLLSDVRYPSLAGTSVAPDFVEFPARLMENWALEPALLRLYAFHHETGQAIPDELSARISDADRFGRGIETVAHLASVWLDLAWHTRGGEVDSATEFERRVLAELDLPEAIVPESRSVQFSRIFSGDYTTGAYAEMFAAVLEADAFARFAEDGLFNPDLAQALRREIFAPANTREPMESWQAFMGRDPDPEALIERRGLKP